MRSLLPVSLTVTLLCLNAAVGYPDEQVSSQPSLVAAAGKLVPLSDVGGRTVAVDGDLADWGDLREGCIVLSELVDCSWGEYQADDRPDAAIVKLMADQEALYLAARVADASVVSPSGIERAWEGDCVEVFLDLRPVRGEGELLGSAGYTPGVFQFLATPPTDDGKPSAWRVGSTGGTSPGPVEVRGSRAEWGYEIEMRLPLSSLLPASPTDRLQYPLGFTVQIDDIDAPDSPGATQKAMGYSWGTASGYSDNASLFACTARHARPRAADVLRFEPTVWRPDAAVPTARAVVVTEAEAAPVSGLSLKWRHAQSAYDLRLDPPPTDVPSKTVAAVEATMTSDRYEALGVSVYHRALKFEHMAPGRYYLAAHCEGALGLTGSARLYAPAARWRSPGLVAGSPNAEQIGASLEAELGPETYYPVAGRPLTCRAWAYPSSALAFALSEECSHAEREGRQWRPSWQITLTLSRRGHERRLWNGALPIVNQQRFVVPIQDMPAGVYDLRAELVGPDESRLSLRRTMSSRFGSADTGPDLAFRIMAHQPQPLAAAITDAPQVFREAQELGNPGGKQFPLDDMRDCQARSVHDLQLYQGRIYVGVGDWNENRGPINIISLAPVGSGQTPQFTTEFRVDDESVDTLRVCGDTLYVPGIDARESWDLGNYYFKRGGQWTKRRTVPNGLHVLDVIEHAGRLYCGTGTELGAALYESADDGLSWRRCGTFTASEGRFWQLAPVGDTLLASGDAVARGPYALRDGELSRALIPAVPGGDETVQWEPMSRLERFGRGVVYTVRTWGTPLRAPIYYLENLDEGARLVSCFADQAVTDIVVREGMCLVLAAQDETGRGGAPCFRGTIYGSRDLAQWQRVAEARFAALPTSLEVADGAYYVGLSNHAAWESADKASGSIWRLGD